MADECRKRFVAWPQVFVAQFVKIFVPAGGIPRMFNSVEQGPNFGAQLVHTTTIAAICESERFASFTMCATINLVMSALIFTGDLQEVLPGKLAVRGDRGEQCAVCETCKAFSCRVLR
jgi:hypothetical protein